METAPGADDDASRRFWGDDRLLRRHGGSVTGSAGSVSRESLFEGFCLAQRAGVRCRLMRIKCARTALGECLLLLRSVDFSRSVQSGNKNGLDRIENGQWQ